MKRSAIAFFLCVVLLLGGCTRGELPDANPSDGTGEKTVVVNEIEMLVSYAFAPLWELPVSATQDGTCFARSLASADASTPAFFLHRLNAAMQTESSVEIPSSSVCADGERIYVLLSDGTETVVEYDSALQETARHSLPLLDDMQVKSAANFTVRDGSVAFSIENQICFMRLCRT